MDEHDPADVEWAARLFCAMHRIDPEQKWGDGKPWWQRYPLEAKAALDYLQARGEKVTTRDSAKAITHYGCELWADRHDAAPSTPRDN